MPILVVVIAAVVVLVLDPFTIGGFTRGGTGSFAGLTLGLDLEGGAHLVYQIEPAEGGILQPDDADSLRDTVSQRVNGIGTNEPTVQLLGEDQLLVQLPGDITEPRVLVTYRAGVQTNDPIPQPAETIELQMLAEQLFPDGNAQVEIENFATADDGVSEVTYAFRFDSLQPARLDNEGNVVVQGEAEILRASLENTYPAAFSVLFDTTPEPEPVILSTDTVTTLEQETDAVTTVEVLSGNELYDLFSASGRPDVFVAGTTTPTDTTLAYIVRASGVELDSFTPDGEYIPGDENDVLNLLLMEERFLGMTLFGNIISFRVTGGIEQAKALIGSTALLSFNERICGSVLPPADAAEWPPDNLSDAEWSVVRCTNPRYYTERATEIDPADLVSARVGTQEGQVGPVINIEFNDAGSQAFFDVTNRISQSGDRLAIRLDGDELIAPGASTPISGGRAFITGDFTTAGDIETAETIAVQLQSGALPATLRLIQEREVDATLGSDSLTRSLIAAVIGLALLAIFLIAYYKTLGVMATITLVMYALTMVAVIKLIPITLTLSGIAAMILSLGFAVDANVLVSERIKEEVKSGKGLFTAISGGFARAWPSIRDGNLSTLIIAIVLYWFGDRFGTSLIQGFALTLGIGLVLSMFYAYLVNRVLIRILAYSPLGNRTGLFIPVYITTAGDTLPAASTPQSAALPPAPQSVGSGAPVPEPETDGDTQESVEAPQPEGGPAQAEAPETLPPATESEDGSEPVSEPEPPQPEDGPTQGETPEGEDSDSDKESGK